MVPIAFRPVGVAIETRAAARAAPTVVGATFTCCLTTDTQCGQCGKYAIYCKDQLCNIC